MALARAGAIYFALVFGAGFLLGPPRVLWLVPRVGERLAELIEMPIMLGVIVLAARWVARRFVVPPSTPRLLAVGLAAFALLVAAELSLVRWLRGLSIPEYVANRDPVAGVVYLVMLLLFALMPLIAAPRSRR